MYQIIKEQKQEINDLKNKIENLQHLENDVKELMKFKKEIEDINNLYINSNIIDNNNNYKMYLKNWINKDKKIKADLLYRLSRDGDSINTFHQLCDNISPNLTLTESNDGHIFGGYTTCEWDNSNKEKKDGETFLFSLTKKKKFKKKEDKLNERDIYSSKQYGPDFGGNDFYFNPTLKKCTSCSPYYFLNNKDLADNKENTFEVKEVEIYKISFE